MMKTRNIRVSLNEVKYTAAAALIMTLFLMAVVIPTEGAESLTGTVSAALGFSELKNEAGRTFPNVYVSVAELQSNNDVKRVVQDTSALNISGPLFLVSPFFLTMMCFAYLLWSYIKTGKHFNALSIIIIWFLGFFFASLIAVRFAGFLTVPLALGSGILISKLYRIAASGESIDD